MDLRQWMHFYNRICLDMGHNPRDDTMGAMTLAALLEPAAQLAGLEALRRGIEGREAVVAGPALTVQEKNFLSSLTDEKVLIAADSALKTLVESDVFPGVVVTDLDGEERFLLEASQRGAVMVVHAHGDNVQRLVELVPKLAGPVVGTCQVMPPPPLVNWGGYTDGDRAALMALENRVAKVVLAGFDFEKPVAKEGMEMERKLKKLRWAKEILEWAAMQGAPLVFFEAEKK